MLVIKADWLAELPTLGPERVTRIELALSAWEADVLPLNYTREARNLPKFAIYANRLGRTTVATSSYRNR
jgi:hypothetical protein